MQVKGTAVISTLDYVKQNYAGGYDEWIDSLPDESKDILQETVLPSKWYPAREAVSEPTRAICSRFFNGSVQGAWEMGKTSASNALTGIYKVFVKAGSPAFIIKKARRIFSTYYDPSEIEVENTGDKEITVKLLQFPCDDAYIENRIGGWIECAMEISSGNPVKTTRKQSKASGDPVTEYVFQWQ